MHGCKLVTENCKLINAKSFNFVYVAAVSYAFEVDRMFLWRLDRCLTVQIIEQRTSEKAKKILKLCFEDNSDCLKSIGKLIKNDILSIQ